MSSEWSSRSAKSFDDGFHNTEYAPHPFPDYIKNADRPFALCTAVEIGSTEWCGTDSQQKYEQNLIEKPADWHYRTKKVDYKVNSDGYRTEEWSKIDWANSIVLLGCSCTFGVGLAEDETISHILQQETGRPVINLGFPGGSNELILQNSIGILENFSAPYAVVSNFTPTDRFRFFHKNGYHECGAWISIDKKHRTVIDNVNVSELWRLTNLSEANEIARTYYTAQAIKWLWAGKTHYHAISFFDLTAHYARANKFFFIDNAARDSLHPGVECSRTVSNYLTSVIK